jgi:hypothetical protein
LTIPVLPPPPASGNSTPLAFPHHPARPNPEAPTPNNAESRDSGLTESKKKIILKPVHQMMETFYGIF